MKEKIEKYAKRLKWSWIRQHFHEIEVENNHEYFLNKVAGKRSAKSGSKRS